MGECADCKFEEFFLSAWSVGDPAMLVIGRPTRACRRRRFHRPRQNHRCRRRPQSAPPPNLGTRPHRRLQTRIARTRGNLHQQRRPTPSLHSPKRRERTSDDPSNVPQLHQRSRQVSNPSRWKRRDARASPTCAPVASVAQQRSGSYLDSQMISPGASYTLEMVYNGSGNRNKVVGDSIFHCHFYPHFAAGMWRCGGRMTCSKQEHSYSSSQDPQQRRRERSGGARARALPDGRSPRRRLRPGAPPTLPMAPQPAYAQIQNNVQVNGAQITVGGQVVIGGTARATRSMVLMSSAAALTGRN
ncbi:MAG: hypothetical protein Udaeo2_25540 [Candidatus Udaeobacter sp.]|nr:MAG: hypothetical protein Udaeo2_25540 [Candidatus Udaeobacter sp.]